MSERARPVERNLRVSINPKMIDKNATNDNALWKDGWVNVGLTLLELATTVKQGVAYCCQFCGPRKSANFLASDVVSVDIDGTMTIEDALDHPLVRHYAGLIYTTARHTPEQHRFRIVFVAPRTITDAGQMRAAARSLALRLAGDLSAIDPSMFWFGCMGARVWLFDQQLSNDLLQGLIDQSGALIPHEHEHNTR